MNFSVDFIERQAITFFDPSGEEISYFLVAELILLAVLILCPEVTLALPRLLGLIN